MRITYDQVANAAYIYLTGEPLTPGRDTVICDLPDDARGFVAMDWKDGKIVGLEVLAASSVLHADLLAQARPPGAGKAGASQSETQGPSHTKRSPTWSGGGDGTGGAGI